MNRNIRLFFKRNPEDRALSRQQLDSAPGLLYQQGDDLQSGRTWVFPVDARRQPDAIVPDSKDNFFIFPSSVNGDSPRSSFRNSVIIHSTATSFSLAKCKERALAAAGAGAVRQARGVIVSTGQSENKGGDVSGTGDTPVETNMIERHRHVMNSSRKSPPPLPASHSFAMLALLRDRLISTNNINYPFLIYPGKTDLHIRVPAGFTGPG